MFDAYVFTEGTCKNVIMDGETKGFQLQTLITYYRGIPCSMIHDIKVSVDGNEIPRENIRFSPNGEDPGPYHHQAHKLLHFDCL